jgi:hypothetical protein
MPRPRVIICSNCKKVQFSDGSWGHLSRDDKILLGISLGEEKHELVERLCPDCEDQDRGDFNDQWNDKNNRDSN